MINGINTHFCEQYGRIRLAGKPIKVCGHGEARPKGKTRVPCVAISYLGFRIQNEYVRGQEILSPNDSTTDVTIPPELGHLFRAKLTSTNREPYQIPEGGAWGLKTRVRTRGAWKLPYTAGPIPGERSAAEVARSLNYWLQGITSWATDDGRVTIEAIDQAADLEVLDFDTSLHDVLGFPVGARSHLDRTGPATWTVTPHPLPIELHWQTEFLTSESAQNDAFLPIALNACQHRHWARIENTDLRFDAENPVNLDELDKPLFRTALSWWVGTLWVESLEQYQVSSILAPSLEWAD